MDWIGVTVASIGLVVCIVLLLCILDELVNGPLDDDEEGSGRGGPKAS